MSAQLHYHVVSRLLLINGRYILFMCFLCASGFCS